MTDERDPRNKLDILKVKRKIFESYPANSVARKNMIAEEKQRDLQHLHNSIPHGAFKLAIAVGYESIGLFLKRFLVHAFGLLGTIVLWMLFVSTTFEAIFLGSIAGFFLYKIFVYGKATFLQLNAMIKLKREYDKLQNKAERMKKDLFES